MQIEAIKSFAPILLKISWLSVSCVAASWAPTLLVQLPSDSILTLLTWKLQITLLVVSALAYFELRKVRREDLSLKSKFLRKLAHMMFAGFCYVLWLIGLLEACKNTIVLHALLLNSLGIFIGPIWGLIYHREVNTVKMVSILLAIIGVTLMVRSTYKGECFLGGNDKQPVIRFDILNIASSVAGYFYFKTNDFLNKFVPKFTLMAITSAFSLMFWWIFLTIKMSYDGVNPFTMNTQNGVFGWVHNYSIAIQWIIVIAVVGKLLANFGYVYWFKFWSPIAISNILFVEPFIGQFIAVYFMKINQFPSMTSIAGALIIILGMYICREAQAGKYDKRPRRRLKPKSEFIEMEVKLKQLPS